MVLDALLWDEVRISHLVAKVGKMGNTRNSRLTASERELLRDDIEKAIFTAYGALLVLRRDLDNQPLPDNLLDPNELGELVQTGDMHLNYEKAAEQAISLIVDSGAEQGSMDDHGQNVGGLLQSVLMMAVYLKSDIFDHLDGPHI